MPNWTAVSQTDHANKRYIPGQGYTFAADDQVVPILIAELPRLIPHYALGFIHQQSNYHPVALTGPGSGQNLYVNHDGKWLANYVPASLRRHPFRLLRSEGNQLVLCIREDHLTDEPQGEPLFDEGGGLAAPVQKTLDFLNQCDKNRRVTQAACQALDKAGVIEKWDLQVNRGEGKEPVRVDGLYRINEKAMNSLDSEPFAGLRSHGALPLAYAQLFTMNQVYQLTERAKYHAKQQQASQPVKPDLEKFFGDDDLISFGDE